MCTDLRIVVAGHSFVGHLKRFLEDDNDVLNRYNLSFNLYRENAESTFITRSGCNVPLLKSALRSLITTKYPHLIILEIGSNDLTKSIINPTTLAQEVLMFSKSQVKSCTKFVIISAVIYREKTKSLMNPCRMCNALMISWRVRASCSII